MDLLSEERNPHLTVDDYLIFVDIKPILDFIVEQNLKGTIVSQKKLSDLRIIMPLILSGVVDIKTYNTSTTVTMDELTLL